MIKLNTLSPELQKLLIKAFRKDEIENDSDQFTYALGFIEGMIQGSKQKIRHKIMKEHDNG